MTISLILMSMQLTKANLPVVGGLMPLDLTFLKPGIKLHLGTMNNFETSGFVMCIFMKSGNRIQNLTSLKDLTGHVKIDEPAEALQFVRLATSPALVEAWPGWPAATMLEVRRDTDNEDELYFGSTALRSFRTTEGSGFLRGWDIAIPSAFFDQYCKPASVSKSGAAYHIKRYVVTRRYEPGQQSYRFLLHELEESVGSSGAYKLLYRKEKQFRDGPWKF